VERVSYPVMTPSAARGVLEAILMKPIEKPETEKRHRKEGFRWRVLRIGIVKSGVLVPILRNELGYQKHSYQGYDIVEERTQRHSLILRDVEYLIEAALEVPHSVDSGGDAFPIAKYQKMFVRRVQAGQCYHRPYLGCREFPCDFEWAPAAQPAALDEDFGLLFRDFDFEPLWDLWPAGTSRPLWWERDGQTVTPVPRPGLVARAEQGWIKVAEIREHKQRKEVVDL
jgi:CRISPR-associated protein Cas5d